MGRAKRGAIRAGWAKVFSITKFRADIRYPF